jgi:hypothetical protein
MLHAELRISARNLCGKNIGLFNGLAGAKRELLKKFAPTPKNA